MMRYFLNILLNLQKHIQFILLLFPLKVFSLMKVILLILKGEVPFFQPGSYLLGM